MSQIVGILLAAGSSRRFGADKRLHPLPDGTPMALASARNLAAVCARTIVVIRPDDTVLASLLVAEGLETVVCDAAEQGMGHSLSSGVAESAGAAGWLVALADMPYIQPASYHAVLHAMQDWAALARPIHDGSPGHPVAFGAAHLDKLLALTGDQGGKAILEADPVAVVLCSVDDPGVLKDIDVPMQIETPGSPAGALSA
ncbi:nucleotidyltransferase family protein [Ferribacterium limneticum]|uniref:nucleotidyltransferase family protein n=1 Tax=Ferribacterium limneticum TaxID=76259 RepID=UPI001CFC2299|nr:nucleotidyltransferase family protein [Ferribacterium limneticum]UCV17550.1 nucleotidyltransferase family protein [Ferribacterium limneticum]